MGNADTKLNFRKAVVQLTSKTQVRIAACLLWRITYDRLADRKVRLISRQNWLSMNPCDEPSEKICIFYYFICT